MVNNNQYGWWGIKWAWWIGAPLKRWKNFKDFFFFSKTPALPHYDFVCFNANGARRGSSPPFSSGGTTFQAIVSSLLKEVKSKPTPSHFLKRFENIPTIFLLPMTLHLKALAFLEWGLLGQFSGLWPSPMFMEFCILKSWKVLIKGDKTHYAHARSFYSFLFKN